MFFFVNNPTAIKLLKQTHLQICKDLFNVVIKRINYANFLKTKIKSSRSWTDFYIHYKVDNFENVLHGVTIQCISRLIQVLLDVVCQPACNLIDY